MFIVTVVAARQLTRDDFGLFALASTLGWLGSVAADFGIQVHLARAVSQHPESGKDLLRRWLPVRIATGLAALMLAWLAIVVLGVAPRAALPMLYFMLAYAAGGLTDCLYYFFRGLDRTDLESTLTLAQRGGMFVLAVAALWWRPDVALLGQAMLVPALAVLLVAGYAAWRLALRHGGQRQSDSDPVEPRVFLERGSDWRRHPALGPLFQDRRLLARAVERDDGRGAVQRRVPRRRCAAAVPGCRARRGAAGALPCRRFKAAHPARRTIDRGRLWRRGRSRLTASWVVPAIYGAPYADAVQPFRTLLLALPLMALNYALTQQLIGWHGQRAYATVCAGALAFNLLLNWQLIRRSA